jgi:magnesium-transporting ATPase (P-type)
MVTGDHPLTARSIATQIGILTKDEREYYAPIYDTSLPTEIRNNPNQRGVVVTGSELEKMQTEDWVYVLGRPEVVLPEHYLIKNKKLWPNYKNSIMWWP